MSEPIRLIPYPQSLKPKSGEFVWNKPNLNFDALYFEEANFFTNHLPGLLSIEHDEERPCKICLVAEKPQSNRSEAYQLKITSSEIMLTAASPAGMFYALQTLLQLINSQAPNEDTTTISLPCMDIIDQPRFRWRGFMLDEARHFFGKKTVKQILDWMAYLKLNTFHWHLTDDQGWRLESKNYPLLTEIGAFRERSQTGGLLTKTTNNITHRGFYSQEDIREIVTYAAERHINVVPEIEIPGHSLAALAAYPSLGCTGGPYQVTPFWGIHKEIYCPGKKGTIPFLEDILKEVIELFPGKYIHIGGDEAPKTRWNNCPDCQALINQLELKNANALQAYLTNHLTRFLATHNRQTIGWNEILAPQLNPDTIVQYWLGKEKNLWQHVRAGRKTILSNYRAYYLDHSYLHSPLDFVYRYEPVSPDLEPEFYENILGIETPLWTEFVPNQARLDWQLFPRLFAIAETAWLMPEKKEYEFFKSRLNKFLPEFDQNNLLSAPPDSWEPPQWKRLWGWPSLLQAQTAKVNESK
jgi:hexosaminidase